MAGNELSVCQDARLEIISLQYEEVSTNDDLKLSFFPLDRLRKFFTSEKVDAILRCHCQSCRRDRYTIAVRDSAHFSSAIVNNGGNAKDLNKTAYGLFGLLVYISHPILVIGFLQRGIYDLSLEQIPEAFRKTKLQEYFENYATNDERGFQDFVSSFRKSMREFGVRHIDSSPFSQYPVGTILPFIKEREVGKQKDEYGEWSNIGANGRVYAFEIYDEYRVFKHASNIKTFARKVVEISPGSFTEHVEKANVESAQNYNDKHIVKLIKAYSLGSEMNLIFPLARTNLDLLLRNADERYARFKEQLEDSDAWRQLLGIANALSRIAGAPSSAVNNRTPEECNVPRWIGFHFDLKPANILISDDSDGTWLITDFGQSSFMYTSEKSVKARNSGGTDAYAPPEVIDNDDKLFRQRYDVWSLGCIALEITAFVVLGHEGLIGSEGLDKVRESTDNWSRRTDSRFWYRQSSKAEPEVKPEILKFIADLKIMQGHSQRSKRFLAEILKLIEEMLQPDVEKRIDIWEVIRLLNVTIMSASPGDRDQLLQTIARKDEQEIGVPDLGLVKIRHWYDTLSIWPESTLRVFENLNGSLRFCSVSNNNFSTSRTLVLFRKKTAILPHYAYWALEEPKANEECLSLSDLDTDNATRHEDAMYKLKLEDARIVQSKLTYQRIEESFVLKSVIVQKYVNGFRKTIGVIADAFHAKKSRETVVEKLNEGRDLGPGTIQLWTEEIDPLAVLRRKKEFSPSAAASAKRKSRLQLYKEQVHHDIYPRRAVIYLHTHKWIILVKIESNWKVREEKPNTVHFQPTDPTRDEHFQASIIQPTSDKGAAIPLCPQVLSDAENVNLFEADEFILHFAQKDKAGLFNEKYRSMKKAWDNEKKQAGTPGRDATVPSHRSSTSESSNQVLPVAQEHYAPQREPPEKGKGRAIQPVDVSDDYQDHSQYQSREGRSRSRHPTLSENLKPQRQGAMENSRAGLRSWSRDTQNQEADSSTQSVVLERLRYS